MQNTIIQKEELGQYQIVNAPEDKSEIWKQELAYGMRLGNEFKGKTNISFATTDGIKTIQTTVWTITDKYLQIKSGVLLPLKSITDVSF